MTDEHEPNLSEISPNLPDWGVYLRWPANNDTWVHPDDLAIAKQLIPSNRVFKRSAWDGKFYSLHYGDLCLHVKPSLWLPVGPVDLAVGQQVELLARQGKNDPGMFRIAEIEYNTTSQCIEYALRRDLLELERRFSRSDLRPLRTHYHLRPSFFRHSPPRFTARDKVDLLDVGDLLDES